MMNIRNNDKSTSNLIHLYGVMSPEAIEVLKDELVAECAHADMVDDKEALKEQLFNDYLKNLSVQIIPDEPVVAEPEYENAAEVPYLVEHQRRIANVRSRRRSTYFAKKNLSRKAMIANSGKETRWMEDWRNHRGFILMKNGEIIKAGKKGSKTERMWRLSKAAKKIGMAG